MFKKLVSIVVSLSLLVSLCSVNFASSNQLTTNQNQILNVETTKYLEAMEQYLKKNSDGTLQLDVPKSKLNKQYHAEALRGLKMTNSMIRKGYLVANSKCELTITKLYVDSLKNSNSKKMIQSTNSIKGYGEEYSVTSDKNTLIVTEKSNEYRTASAAYDINKLEWHGLYFKLYLSNKNTVLMLTGATGAVFVLEKFFDTPNAKIIANWIIVGGLIYGGANAAGRGIIIYGTTTLPYGVVWVSSQ